MGFVPFLYFSLLLPSDYNLPTSKPLPYTNSLSPMSSPVASTRQRTNATSVLAPNTDSDGVDHSKSSPQGKKLKQQDFTSCKFTISRSSQAYPSSLWDSRGCRQILSSKGKQNEERPDLPSAPPSSRPSLSSHFQAHPGRSGRLSLLRMEALRPEC